LYYEISIKHLTFTHQGYLRGLDFYELELRFLQERLEEIASDNTAREVAEKTDHFQNQLTIHKDKIDELKHRLNENIAHVKAELDPTGSFINEDTGKAAELMAEDYRNEEMIFNGLRHEFNRFVAQWM